MTWEKIRDALFATLRTEAFKKWFITIAVPMLAKGLASLWPVLGWPGVGFIVGFGMEKLVEFLYKIAEFKIIEFKNSAELEKYRATVLGVQLIIKKGKDATPEEIEKALKDLETDGFALIHFK